MRYYDIQITNPTSGKPVRQFGSLNTLGQTIPGALNIELDVPLFRLAEPAGAAYVKVWGISIKDIAQALNLNGAAIKVRAGMARGLPLANPKQAGLILDGVIQQAYGNWQGTEQTLDFVINVAAGAQNIVLEWSAGQTLGNAVKAALALAFPAYELEDRTSADLVLNQDEPGFYETIAQFAAYVKEVSQHILGPKSQGVDIAVRGQKFIIYDGTTKTAPAGIAFVDLIGQPTWKASATVQFKTAMRADLNVSDYIQLPPGQVTTSAQSQSQYRNGSIFSGVFQIDAVRHVGNFRQPDANSWVSVFDCHAE